MLVRVEVPVIGNSSSLGMLNDAQLNHLPPGTRENQMGLLSLDGRLPESKIEDWDLPFRSSRRPVNPEELSVPSHSEEGDLLE